MGNKISFQNTKQIRDINLERLKKLKDYLVSKFSEQKIYFLEKDYTDNANDYQALFFKKPQSRYGFQLTIFHESGIEVKIIKFKNPEQGIVLHRVETEKYLFLDKTGNRMFLWSINPEEIFEEIKNNLPA